jgi:hypothetical protein
MDDGIIIKRTVVYSELENRYRKLEKENEKLRKNREEYVRKRKEYHKTSKIAKFQYRKELLKLLD